jgi:hypothetical protein
MRQFIVEKKEGLTVVLRAHSIQVIDGVLYVTENRHNGPELVGVFCEYAACFEVRPLDGGDE